MLGSSIVEEWKIRYPDDECFAVNRAIADLRDRGATTRVISEFGPEVVVHTAAKVGGAGDKVAKPLPYLLDNLTIDSNVISAAIEARVPEFLYIASAVVYPAEYVRPFVESDLLTGGLESVNEGYGLAKLAGLKLCEYASRQYGLAYRSAVPSNLYGLRDKFDLMSGHLIPAAIAKIHEAHVAGASEVSVWGDGTARREFTFATDIASWLVGQIGSLSSWPSALNIGCGEDHSVREYYEVARDIVGFAGKLSFDESKPSGVPKRLIDSRHARELGWRATTSLVEGMTATYADYLSRTFKKAS